MVVFLKFEIYPPLWLMISWSDVGAHENLVTRHVIQHQRNIFLIVWVIT